MITYMYRALYSLIQFTTITLLYSFASSLGDFQVSILVNITKDKGVLIALKFLYIDLFVIIPVAVSSELLETIQYRDTDRT